MDISTTLLTGVAATKYSTGASLAFLLYDYVLTLDSEMTFVWNMRWSSGKAIFFFNRYFGLFTMLFNAIILFNDSLKPKFCQGFIAWEVISSGIIILSAEMILVARIHAVYDRSRKLLIFLASIWIAELINMTVLDVLVLHLAAKLQSSLKLPNEALPISGLSLKGCFVVTFPAYFFMWIPPLAFETILYLLMAYKVWRIYRVDRSNPLLMLLIRDSFLYFLSNFAILLINCLLWVQAGNQPTDLIGVAVGWSVAIPCAMGSRLLLNIRERYFKEQTSSSTGAYPQNGIELREGTYEISFAPNSLDNRESCVLSSVME